MLTVKHSKTGKGSVIFNDSEPLILIRGNDWTFYKCKITIHDPDKSIQRELVKMALKDPRIHAIRQEILMLGIDHAFCYTDTFQHSSIKQTEEFMEKWGCEDLK